MLWVDKYRPRTLGSLTYHTVLAERLTEMAKKGDIPHMLFYGPRGAGKSTRVMALLRELFGSGVEKTKLQYKSYKTPTKRTIEITSLASNFHIEFNPSDVGIYDKFIVQEVIKEVAQSGPITKEKQPFKVLILTDVDNLSKQAQHALRRTMELYSGTCRIIMCCQSPSNVIDPLRSRCLGVRIAAPSQKNIMDVLQGVSKREGLTLPMPLAAKISRASDGNLRRAVLMLEACKTQMYPFVPTQPVQQPDWEKAIEALANDVLKEQSPDRLLKCRERLYELLVNLIPADVIIKTLSSKLASTVKDEGLKHQIAHWAGHYEHAMRTGSKEIIHLEAFVAKCMSLIKLKAIAGK